MNQIKTVFAFTFRDAVRKKAFRISTVIMLLLVLVLSLLPKIITALNEEKAAYSDYSCYLIDTEKTVPGAKESLEAAMPGITINEGKAEDLNFYKESILPNNSKTCVINITKKDGAPFLNIISGSFMTTVPSDLISTTLSKTYSVMELSKLGIDQNAIAIAQMQIPYSYEMVGDMNFSGFTVGILLTMLIFFAIYYYGYGVSMSVATEKTSRVMESLVVSAKPSKILIGKCLAMGVVGLAQFSLVIGFASVCVSQFIPDDFTVMGMPFSFSAFTIKSALLILLYFLLGYALYAVLNSVSGASVSKIEDLNSAMMPVMLLAIISFYIGYIAAVSGSDGILVKIAMFLPFSSPFIMPFRLLNGTVATFDLIISLILLATFIVIFTYISIRIYSASVLNYGKKQKLSTLYKTKL